MVTSRYIVWWKLNLCFLYSHWKTVLKFYDVIKVLQRALQRLTKAAIVRKRSLIAIENIKDIKQAVESVFYGRQKNPRELEIVHSGCWWLTRNTILSNNITFNGPHMAFALSKFFLYVYLIFWCQNCTRWAPDNILIDFFQIGNHFHPSAVAVQLFIIRYFGRKILIDWVGQQPRSIPRWSAVTFFLWRSR